MERNLRLLLSYDGTDFHGWQVQPGRRTVQDVIEQQLRRVLRHDVSLRASGRTDSGVHAVGQVASVVTDCTIPCDRLRHAIGSRLPDDLDLRAVSDVAMDFHATHSATGKLYRYRIFNATHRPVTRSAGRYAYHFWEPLDTDRMRAAAARFIGEKDFTSMAASKCVRRTMVRRVMRCDIDRHYDEIRVDVEGGGFLYNQVRNMVGTLIEVGRGRWQPEHIDEIIAARDRSCAGPTAPAKGLSLQWVRYPASLLRPESNACERKPT